MKSTLDYFSDASQNYNEFRPDYPDALFEFILKHVPNPDLAWDCGTGNGQAALALSHHFKQVWASDISLQQINSAPVKDNIHYLVQRAEMGAFKHLQFDLITVAQALHWFDIPEFFKTAREQMHLHSTIAVWGYQLLSVSPEIDVLIKYLYKDILGEYWPPERKLVDDAYQSIDFPFQKIDAPVFFIERTWTLQQLTGYICTWSAVKRYQKSKVQNPLEQIFPQLVQLWPEGTEKLVRFPVFMRLGKPFIN